MYRAFGFVIWDPACRHALAVAEEPGGRALVAAAGPCAAFSAAVRGASCRGAAEAGEPCAHVPEGDRGAVRQVAQTRCLSGKRALPEPCLCRRSAVPRKASPLRAREPVFWLSWLVSLNFGGRAGNPALPICHLPCITHAIHRAFWETSSQNASLHGPTLRQKDVLTFLLHPPRHGPAALFPAPMSAGVGTLLTHGPTKRAENAPCAHMGPFLRDWQKRSALVPA